MFHLTSAARWASIVKTRKILPRVELVRRGLAQQPEFRPASASWDALVHELVWLTVNPLPRDRWLDADGEHKGDVIITVEPGAEPWTTFARLRGVPERYLIELRKLGNPSEWFVSTAPIPSSRWLRVLEGRAGQVLWESGSAIKRALLLCVECKRAILRKEALELDGLTPLCTACFQRRQPAEKAAQAQAARRRASRGRS